MKTGKNRQTGNQNPFNPQSSGQGSPYGNAGGTPFGGGMGNAGGAPFGGGSGGFGGGSFGGGMGNAGGTPFGGGSGKYNGQFGYNGMSPMNTRKRTRFSKLFLIVSLIVSVIFFLLGEVIYRTLITGVNSVVFMGVYFALFGLLLSIGLFVVAKISDLEITSNKILLVGGCVLLLLILGILFEFIYELDFSSVRTVADNYVFAIDNSGSMQDNDPNQERVAAIKQLLSNRDEDVEFAVYTFSEDIRCIREMMPVSAGIEDFTTEPNGGTPIVGVLGKIMDDMESGALPYDEGTQVILLTDGYATDNGFFDFRLNKILKKYNSKKVSVSTVGLGSVDENMLNDISGKTGGISVRTDNVDEGICADAYCFPDHSWCRFPGDQAFGSGQYSEPGNDPDLVTDRDRVGSSDHGSRPEPDPERIFCTSSDDAAVWNDDHDSGKDDRRNSKRKYRCQIYVIM